MIVFIISLPSRISLKRKEIFLISPLSVWWQLTVVTKSYISIAFSKQNSFLLQATSAQHCLIVTCFQVLLAHLQADYLNTNCETTILLRLYRWQNPLIRELHKIVLCQPWAYYILHFRQIVLSHLEA